MATRSKNGLKPIPKNKPSLKTRATFKVGQKNLPILQKKQKNQKRMIPARKKLAIKVTKRRDARTLQRTRTLPIARNVKRIRAQTEIPSAVIWHAAYDEPQKVLVVDFNTGRRAAYFDVTPFDAYAFLGGKASCTTEGQNQYGKWFKGKNPSLGAAFWRYIRRKNYRFEYLTTPAHVLPTRAIPQTPFTTAQGWTY